MCWWTLEDDPDWADWSIGQLRAQAQVHQLVINLIIYAELSLAFATVEALNSVMGAGRRNQEKAIASRLFTLVYFRSSTRRRFLLQFGPIVINAGTDEIF